MSISDRNETSFRERMRVLSKMDAHIQECSACPLHRSRKTPLAGRFVEPSDAVLINLLPHATEDEEGNLLGEDRIKSFDKLFSFAKPSLDINKVSYLTVYKCFGEDPSSTECLTYLNDQLDVFDPILILPMGNVTTRLISGKELESGIPHCAGDKNQFIIFPLMHPAELKEDLKKNMPIWRSQLKSLATLAQKYDLNLFKK